MNDSILDRSAHSDRQLASFDLTVGARVRTTTSHDDGDAHAEAPEFVSGVIVDDFGEVLTPHDHYGRDWARTKRWSIALDSGQLVFRHGEELVPEL
ncbi:hypothetical protein [Antrihabitans spumae]|uniref:Uncharacterized protein n=1 Tax=Antrihabitans spumae TaxID=3373370 RepID=A0ABW7K3D5_9NOCA